MKMKYWCLVAALLLSVMLAVPGTLAYTMDASHTLRNSFAPAEALFDEVSVTVPVRKRIVSTGDESISPEGFAFTLTSATGETLRAISDKDGHAAFELTFARLDAGVHTFTLAEENTARPDVTYSKRTYQVQVEVLQEPLCAVVRVDGVAGITPVFENIYHTMDIPETGDETQLMLYLALAVFSGTLLAALLKKLRRQDA